MPTGLPQFDIAEWGAWLVVAIAAVAILTVVLRIISKVVSTSLRLAIILGSLLVIALSLFVLAMLLREGAVLGL